MRNPFAPPAGTRWGPVALAVGLVAVTTLVPTRAGAGGVGTLGWCLPCGDYGAADAAANVALFVPLGWALARARVRPLVGLALIMATTICVELLQYLLIRGRTASVSDVITNTVGGMAGMTLPSLSRWITRSGGRATRGAIVYGVLLVAGLGAGVATQALRLPRTLRWTEGHLGRPTYVPFTGTVTALRVNGAPVRLDQWSDVPPREDVEITVDLRSGRPDTGLAQIVIGWMPDGDGWMWLEQRDRDLRVHIASASDSLRLRGHSAWLDTALPATAHDMVSVRLMVRRFSYRVDVRTTAGDVARDVRVTPGDGWRLFTPLERAGPPWTALLTGGWMAALLGPLGYLAAVRSRATTATAAVGAGAALLLLPLVLGSACLPVSGWCGATSGFLIGVHRMVTQARRRA